ncbi:MAG: 5-methyltetrahydropteroyltriglutamate--homocysteine S-methyltransferase [Alphaproteobacteria bacterium]|nr:5-methyltetrahydropteroyltriglutamate--homocysteine S-methyltransferase [Alphaproteobacteria bacterium]
MAIANILGFPRIGQHRELKTALESFWQNKISESDLEKTAATLRKAHWKMQIAAGITGIPSNDFSLYDGMLDMSALLGVVPERYRAQWGIVDLATYFAMARGIQKGPIDIPAAEMTKWFDTNYHYIVPELNPNQNFRIASYKPVREFTEAKSLGITTRPVLVGPITYLLLGKMRGGGNKLDLLPRLIPIYSEILKQLEVAGAEWVQLDEPMLVGDINDSARAAYTKTYETLRQSTKLKIFVTSYFGALGENLDTVINLPIDALHIDIVRGPEQLDEVLQKLPSSMILSMGVVDGRNVWHNKLTASLDILDEAAEKIGSERIWVSPSCSLLHVPYDLDLETTLDPALKNWLAFGKQKLGEIAILTKGLNHGHSAIADLLVSSDETELSRRIHNPEVRERLEKHPLTAAGRKAPFAERRVKQKNLFNLPQYPTTTIGSFPQTAEVRKMRADFKQGRISEGAYDSFLEKEIKAAIKFQEDIDLDVLVHGEFERNDMVEYFGERLEGFAFTKHGWVQSYGSRVVKPPIIFGDVYRTKPMTTKWSVFAQKLTKKPVKGMLTGPVTILQWSFVRDDQPRSTTAHQIALALQDEVLDLEWEGIKIIQIDEPAFREGLPLRRCDWQEYLTWATRVFRLAYTGVRDDTQIHTHMCYSEFNDIIDSIRDLDADVISIETSRSQMELLDAFSNYRYPNEIGPGVYDIHSPRVPKQTEMIDLLEKARLRLSEDQLWVNPDCGLKTRGWTETKAALANMVSAAKHVRSERGKSATKG